MAVIELLLTRLELFLVLLVRIAGMFALLPLYGEKGIPNHLKAGIALFLAYLALPTVWAIPVTFPESFGAIVVLLLSEFVVGLAFGFTVRIVLASIQVAGQMIGFQMGFAIVNVIDPSGQQISLIGRFQELVALALFFGLSLDHIFLSGVLKSFQIVPPLGFSLTAEGLRLMFQQTYGIWSVAVRIGAPVMIALFATNVAMGLMARSVPQMNVFIVGFPVGIGVGLTLLGLSLPMFVYLVKGLFVDLGPVLARLMTGLT